MSWALPYVLTGLIATSLALGVKAPEVTSVQREEAVIGKRPGFSFFFGTLTAIVLCGVASIRWHLGADYWDYEAGFPKRVQTPLSSLGIFDEPGLYVLAKLGALIKYDPAMMFGIASCLTIGLFVWTFYRTSNLFAASIALIMLTGIWQSSFNGVRQYLACAILFAGHGFIIKRQLLKYSIIVLIAMLFHVSALAMLPLFWIPRNRLTLVQILILIGASLFALTAYDAFINIGDSVRGSGYTYGDYFARSINPLRIAAAIAPIFVFLFLSNHEQLSKREYFYVNMIFINAAILIAAANSTYLARFGIYTGIYSCIGIPAIINMRSFNVRMLAYLGVLSAYAIFWYFETINNVNLLHFRTLWERPDWYIPTK